MRSCFAHTPGAATGAESTALTTEGDQVFELTGLALGPQKPARQNPTAKILIKLFNHKIWKWKPGIIFDLVLKSEPWLTGRHRQISSLDLSDCRQAIIGFCSGKKFTSVRIITGDFFSLIS